MVAPPLILPIECPYGNAGSTVFTFYIDTPNPALIDTGVALSPAEVIEPYLRANGRSLADVRWILTTHGHWDHTGGAWEARQRSAEDAQLVIHQLDAAMLGSRRRHLDGYAGWAARYLSDKQSLARTEALLLHNISGEIAPDRELTDGDRIDLGGGFVITVIHTPGHSPGSVTYLLEGKDAFVGDAVQVGGSSAGRFPYFVDPVAYRASLTRLVEDVKPARLLLGHHFLDARGGVLDAVISGGTAIEAIRTSLEIEGRLARTATPLGGSSIAIGDVAAFGPVAAALGYGETTSSWPGPFLATMAGYMEAESKSAP